MVSSERAARDVSLGHPGRLEVSVMSRSGLGRTAPNVITGRIKRAALAPKTSSRRLLTAPTEAPNSVPMPAAGHDLTPLAPT